MQQAFPEARVPGARAVTSSAVESLDAHASGTPAARPLRRPSAAGPATLAASDEPDWLALEPKGFYARVGKPAFEALLLSALLPLAIALALPVALANWIAFRDVRRILFAQERVGARGRTFTLLKFRTMRDATRGGAFESWGEGGDEARVTPLGRFLRNSHLDELPQLLNVLRGDMALIGPRPEMVEIERWAQAFVPGFSSRLAVQPGITGWAQVLQGYTAKDVVAYERKLELGLEYAADLTFAKDLRVIALTARDMLARRGWRWREDAARASGAG